MKSLVNNDYTEVLSEQMINNPGHRVWYLPHHAVSKKSGRIRIVSLNSACLQGPDRNNKLFSILIGFRQHQYAVMADVEAMYHQVRIPDYDRDALRYLWRDDHGNVTH